MSAGSGAYAACQDCSQEFADRDEMSAHLRETVKPNGETTGVTASGHRARVINPTPEEQRASFVRAAIERALDDLYDDLDEDVRRGHFSEAEVKKQMVWFDLADGWDDYVQEASDDL